MVQAYVNKLVVFTTKLYTPDKIGDVAKSPIWD